MFASDLPTFFDLEVFGDPVQIIGGAEIVGIFSRPSVQGSVDRGQGHGLEPIYTAPTLLAKAADAAALTGARVTIQGITYGVGRKLLIEADVVQFELAESGEGSYVTGWR